MSEHPFRVELLDADGVPIDDAAAAGWRLELTTAPAPGPLPALNLVLIATWTGAHPVEAGIRVSTTVDDCDDPWWLIPGAFYGENRPAENDRVFPRFEVGAGAAEQHAAFVSEAWEFRSDRAAAPIVMVWSGPDRGGVALEASATSALGLTGLGIRHDAAARRAVVHATFPFRERPVSYFGDGEPRPAEVTTHRFAPGEQVRLRLRRTELPASRAAHAPVLRELYERTAPSAPLRPWVSVPEAAELTAHGLLRWHYDPDPGVLLETVGFDREVSGRDGLRVDRHAMHVGWVSGAPWATALLRHAHRTGASAGTGASVGSTAAEQRDAAVAVLDFLTSDLSPSGTLWGVWYRDSGWGQSWTSRERGLHSRTLGEAVLFLVRALALEPDHPQWLAAVRSNLDAVVARQRADGDLGAIHHAETGEVLSWAGAAGLAWVSALAEARELDQRYLPAAERAGEHYAAFVEQQYLHGAPEDVDLAPTSEDGYVALMAYLHLWEATGSARWLELARLAADWMLTFRYVYDVGFDPVSMLGVYDFGTRGADQASSSNQHLHAYGLICHRELHLLAEALDDPHYAARADDTLACFRQFVARRDGDFNAYRGMVSERYYQTACFQPKGMLLTLSHAWSVGVLLLACEDELGRAAGSPG